ncbi:hypothetical protein OkiPb01551_29790 [Bordetella pertussis]|nr:hypothetical protein BPJ_03960 [Bordetella pertussis]BDT06692.1 hypothetical protein BP3J_03960 [Bordetella pertussis]CFW34200.1 transposase (partial) [Bordetella pertussis]CPK40060.1 transposase (partial) [Bordetella pertussis]
MLDAHLFANLELVQAITDQWLVDYNQYPSAQIAGRPPADAIHAPVNPRSGRLSDNVYLTGGAYDSKRSWPTASASIKGRLNDHRGPYFELHKETYNRLTSLVFFQRFGGGGSPSAYIFIK